MASVLGGANGDQDLRIAGNAGISLDRGESGKWR